MTAALTGPRDVRDARRLADLEAVIERGKTAFVEVGEALIEVRESKLYRLNYPTFEAYCKGRWGFSRPRAYQLMEAAETVGQIEAVSTTVDIASERIARELAPVVAIAGPEAAAAVMANASANGTPTAETVRAAARPFRPLTDGSAALAPDPWTPGPALMSSDSAEWYTPRRVLDAVVAALGQIDLDPCAEPARSVPAAAHLTLEDDGLAQPWLGTVYMNPPYGRAIVDWTTKLRAEHDAGRVSAAVALVPARTETDWWATVDAEWICLIHGRLSFSDHDTAAPFPSAALYLGADGERFAAAFASLGPVYRRHGQ